VRSEAAMATDTRMQRFQAGVSVDGIAGALEQDGYAIVEGMLNPDEARAKRAELTRVLESTPTGRNDFEGFATRRIYALFAKTRAFDEPATDALLLGVLDRVLGSYHLSAPVGIEIGPGETAQNLHRDDGIYPIPHPHPEFVVNTMWALDDFTEANGATHLIPGSHRWVDRRPEPGAETLRATMPAGSVMFFLGSLFHGGGANTTDRPRLGVILEYCAGYLRQQENHILAVRREVVRTLPRRLQELLGYNIAPPFIGYVDGKHPLKFLNDE
jgi:ectoine hydroxylase-related dioxygenase (phytanoyl-CoA dioxygenase family)